MHTRSRVYHFAFVLICLVCSHARAQTSIEVTAAVEPERAYLGSTFRYVISILSNKRLAVEDPIVNFPNQIRVLSTGSSFMSQPGRARDANGNIVVTNVITQSYTYTLAASSSGTLTIPSMQVVVDGNTFNTNPVDVEIVEPDQPDDFALEARISKPRAYVGEPVTLRLTWYVGRDVQSFALAGGDIPDGLTVEPISDPVAFRDRSGQYLRTEIFGQTIYGKRGQGSFQGAAALTLTYELRIIAERPGTFSLGPIVMIFDTPRRNERGTERGISRTAPIEFTARPIPTDGRPSTFTDLIGSYMIEASASPTDVNVGDPIALQVRITGPNAPRIEDGPNLEVQRQLVDHFKLDTTGWTRVPDSTGRAVFRTTIRALSENVTEIPPLELSYFEPMQGKFGTSFTAPIPITVRSTRDVTLADAILSPLRAPASRSSLDRSAPGIWALASADELARPAPPERIEQWFWYAIAAAPTAALLVIFFSTVRDRATRPGARARHALHKALRLARAGKTDLAVRHYMALRLAQRPDAITADDCARIAATPLEARELAAALERTELARFGGLDRPAPDPERCCQLLRNAHKHMERTQ